MEVSESGTVFLLLFRYWDPKEGLHRVLECLFLCQNWVFRPPSPEDRVCLPPGPKGGGSNTRLRGEEAEGTNSDDWTESLAFWCGIDGEKGPS